MVYREDPDLEFLGQMKSEDLNDLVYCLTHDKDGGERYTEELTKNELYKKYYPDHHQYWREIAAEIQCFGGHSFATFFRGGKGVLYREVLADACEKIGVDYNKDNGFVYNSFVLSVCDKFKVNYSGEDFTSVENVENKFLTKVFYDALKKMKPEELEKMAKEMGVKNMGKITPQLLIDTLKDSLALGGPSAAVLTSIIAGGIVCGMFDSMIGMVAFRLIGRILNPYLLAITTIGATMGVAGPAYRVTIPVVALIAALRKKYMYGDAMMDENFQKVREVTKGSNVFDEDEYKREVQKWKEVLKSRKS